MPLTQPASRTPTLAVIGGGLAGLAAAAAAVEHGLRVELFEARPRLGGRAGSFRDPDSGELVDHCQHVGMGCCTNLADFCRRTGIADCFARHRRLHFIGPDGRPCEFAASAWLPAPLHLAPALLRLSFLSFSERLRVLRTMGRLLRYAPGAGEPPSCAPWLRQQGESEQSLQRFWSVVVHSALSETIEQVSLAAVRKLFLDGFLAARGAHEILLPAAPLGEIYDRRLRAWLNEKGVALYAGTRVRRIEGDRAGVRGIVLPDGSTRRLDYYVVAVPWRVVRALFSEKLLAAMPALEGVERIRPAAITAVHLWVDRPITPLPHALLVGRLSQWVFNRSLQHAHSAATSGVHYEVVISASHALVGRDRAAIVGQVWNELAQVWPAARQAQLRRWRVITQPAAVFSMRPGVDQLRPAQETPIPNLMLAGDWTATGWPGTMESAVRSGYLAVESLLRALGQPRQILAPDLPRARLVRWLIEPATRGSATSSTPAKASGGTK